MTIITLTTDFGSADGYVGAMKGVLLGIPRTSAWLILATRSRRRTCAAPYVLGHAAAFFLGTVHLAVVDPGVGSRRRPLLITTPRASYVGPDNGLFTFALEEAGAAIFELDRPKFWLPNISRTFHGVTSSPRPPRTSRAGLRPVRSAALSAIPCVCPRSLRIGAPMVMSPATSSMLTVSAT